MVTAIQFSEPTKEDLFLDCHWNFSEVKLIDSMRVEKRMISQNWLAFFFVYVHIGNN